MQAGRENSFAGSCQAATERLNFRPVLFTAGPAGTETDYRGALCFFPAFFTAPPGQPR